MPLTSAATTTALQRALLPGDLPVLPGLDLAADYLMAADEKAGRGDWFDVVTLPDGRVGLGVGDVVGHGVAAPVTMSGLRTVAAELLISTGDLAETMARLEDYVLRHPEAYGATLCLMILEPRTGAFSYATAGHPPPLLAPRDRAPRYLTQTHDGPLGSGQGSGSKGSRRGVLQTGEAMLLFTDGLLARPGHPWTDRLETLSDLTAAIMAVPTVGEQQLTVERLCHDVIAALAPTCDEDDATVLAIQRRPVIQPLDLTFPGRPDMLTGLRKAVHGWAQGLHLTRTDQYAIEFAISEAAANSIDHGYAGRAGSVHAHADLSRHGAIELTVEDEGDWVEPTLRSDGRGVGLAMIQDLTDELTVSPHEHGTTVSMRRRLHRQSGIGDGPRAPDHHREQRSRIDFDYRADPPTIAVSGPIDLSSDMELEAALRQFSLVGARPITVDLSGVTHLASAGVRVLLRHAQQNPGARFVVDDGSPMAVVLTLVALPRLHVNLCRRET